MRNIVPEHALARRSRNLLIAAVLIMILGGFLVVFGLVLRAIPLVVPSNPSFSLYDTVRTLMVIGGGALGFLGILMLARALTWKTDNRLAESTGNALGDFLDERYVFIRNVSKLALGYIDAVLLGPPGVLVFRISNREGVYFNEGGNWMIQHDKGVWSTLRWNPSREVIDDINKLRAWLERRGLKDVPVYGVIVFTKDHPAAQVTQQKPVVPSAHVNELSYALAETYFARDRIDAPALKKLIELLLT